MKIEIDIKKLKQYCITPNQYVLLHLLYYKEYSTIKSVFTKSEVVDSLRSITNYDQVFLNNVAYGLEEIILSKKEVEKILGLDVDILNFWEFYNCYPVKVGPRVLRASGPTTQLALKHEKKYLSKVKTKDQHQKAIKAVTTFVAKQKMSGKLDFLPAMETVLNNAMWQSWEVLIDKKGEENGQWNSETI